MDDAATVTWRVAGHTGRDGHLQRCGLALADDLDLRLDAVCHDDRPAQRDFLFRQPSDDRSAQIERRVGDRRVENARQIDPLLRKIGREPVAAQRHGREDAWQFEDVELVPLERQPARLLLFHHPDFDGAHLRHLLAAHRRNNRPVARIVAGREIPHDFAEGGVCFQRNLRSRHPRFQDVRPGAYRMRLYVTGICIDDLVRDWWEQRHDVGERVVAVLQANA